MPTIFKRSNGIYYFVTTDSLGKRRWVSTGEKKKDLALKKLFQSEKAPEIRSENISLKKFKSDFIEYASQIYSSGNVDIYKKSFSKFTDVVGDISLSSITCKHIDMFKVHRLKSINAVTLNIELRTLKAAFYTALRWKLISENPFKNVKLIFVDEEAPLYFSFDDFHKLIFNIKEKWLKNIVIVTTLTGMRRGEVLNLTWKDIDLKNKLIVVQSHGNFRTKNGKRRIIPMNSCVYEIFEKMPVGLNEEYVFQKDNNKISDRFLTRKFKHYVIKLKLNSKLHFHSLRHSFATWLVQDGASIYEVQKLLGHSNIRVTQVYSHLLPQELHKTVERISFRLN